jgi:hypothetical protein
MHSLCAGEVISLAAVEDDIDDLSPVEAVAEHLNLPETPRSRSERVYACMQTYMVGERTNVLAEDVAKLPAIVILDEQLSVLLEGLDPEAPSDTVQPTKPVAWLPDVSFSHVGQAYRHNAWQVGLQNANS